MLDYDSEGIDGMDDDAGDYQKPAPTEHWKATPTHDVYMVAPQKEAITRNNGTRQRIIPPTNNQNGDADAALSPASTTTALLLTQQ